MTAAEITAVAERIGIKPTRAPVGSEVWQCWADRVQQAIMADRKPIGRGHYAPGSAWSFTEVMAAKAEANRYAV